MKLRKREFDIFNLSFLDVISCGFGAVVMLVLISKPQDDISISGAEQVGGLLSTVIELENTLASQSKQIVVQNSAAQKRANEQGQLRNSLAKIKRQISHQAQQQASLEDDEQGLSLVKSTLKQASIPSSKTISSVRDEEVGGIPVDSDYVIFIVDTSGSMRQIWARVTKEIVNVLNIHPQVKGFQILNDMGTPLVSAYDGKWMTDTPKRRKAALKIFHSWNALSNSSPIEGIEIALRKYAKAKLSTSIYVFGDDYTGGSYDAVINAVNKKNRNKISGKRLAKIHGVGFISMGTTDHFGILMRELTQQNGGTFLALPL